MSTTGLGTFDKTVQETNLWLKGTMNRLESEDRHFAYMALRAVLHALRDRIGPENAVHLGAQLPMLLRGLHYEGWHMAGTPTKERHKTLFFDHVRRNFPAGQDVDIEKVVRAVFDTIWEKVEPGEVKKLANMFPEEMRDLWPPIAWMAEE